MPEEPTIKDVFERLGSVDAKVSLVKHAQIKLEGTVDRKLEAIRKEVSAHGIQIGVHTQRLTHHSEELERLRQDQTALGEGTGKIRLAQALQTGERAGRRKLIKTTAAVVGALLAGGGGTYLIQVLLR